MAHVDCIQNGLFGDGQAVPEKRCSRCRQVKAVTEFYENAGRGLHGRHSLCKLCQRETGKRWREKTRKSHEDHPERKLERKVCSRCRLEKPATDFHANLQSETGLCTYCKECTREYSKRYRDEAKTRRRCREDFIVEGQPVPEKVCADCKERKPITEFYPNSACRYGVSSHCKVCQQALKRAWEKSHPEQHKKASKRRVLVRDFGITTEDYEAMSEAQNERCAICAKPETELNNSRDAKSVRLLTVDHCHKTGRVRGLLCSKCNRGIGSLCEDPALLRAAADYLERHATSTT